MLSSAYTQAKRCLSALMIEERETPPIGQHFPMLLPDTYLQARTLCYFLFSGFSNALPFSWNPLRFLRFLGLIFIVL